jgi:uncharacterized small protein (DUF1192 family)
MTDDFEQDREGTPAEHERNRLLVAPVRELVDRIMAQEAEVDRLRGALERILAEHVPEGWPDRAAEHCAICSPQESRWPCVTVLEARAALEAGNE